ncbi:aminoacyl-tRNA hydrolase [Neorickettsia findlayensis]|uniref:Peptidyl-tRNA hydrolase n=1 Tax=Neorickettsia findlayensis TaxID=2686014 RepID=A0A6P1GA36_9RICK|nr:aminoacyl-tRNA hydrolase [Neorickettsia findlayensis]QHD65083.1 aminoacyl-tRNA hydrolase [Neorickettsia findlayensis]
MSEFRTLVLCGLGNPGLRYVKTRHNLGFMLLDYIRCTFSFPEFLPRFSGLLSSGRVSSSVLHLFKPVTFMNNSGGPLLQLVNFYKVELENVIVFHDDIDLDFAKVKIKKGGGSGGHNGLKSLDANLGTDYWRFRFGVGRGMGDPAVYVLSRFTVLDLERLNKSFRFIGANLPLLLSNITMHKEKFLNEYSLTVNKE